MLFSFCVQGNVPGVDFSLLWSKQSILQLLNVHFQAFALFQMLHHSCRNAVRRCSPPYSIPQLQYFWSSSSLCRGILSTGGCGICCGVGGISFLLVVGGAFTSAPSKFISSSLCTKNASRFLERERVCGSTKSQSHTQRQKGQSHNPHSRPRKKSHIRVRKRHIVQTHRKPNGTPNVPHLRSEITRHMIQTFFMAQTFLLSLDLSFPRLLRQISAAIFYTPSW